MATVSHPRRSLVTQFVPLDGAVSGLREVDSFGSMLHVRAGPLSERGLQTTSGYMAYLVDAPKVYTGHGRGCRSVGDRIKPKPPAHTQAYLIRSYDPHFDKRVAMYVEARLIDIADEAGVPLANSNRPFGGDGLRIDPNLEQLVVHAQELLLAAGFRRFEEARRTGSACRSGSAGTTTLHDVRIIEPEELVIPAGAVRMRLVHKQLKVEGYKYGKRMLVLPGADYARSTSWLSPHNLKRRQTIEATKENFEELPGVTDRLRLRVGLDCMSAPVAASVISGEHLRNTHWEAVADLTPAGEPED